MTDHEAGPRPRRLETPSVDEAVARWFADSTSRTEGRNEVKPRFVLVTGTPASGKTRLRHEKYGRGYVTVDAGDIFRLIPNSDEFDFPGEHEPFVEAVGARVARRALEERRHVVTEVFAADPELLIELIDGMKALGYHTEVVAVRTDLERSIEWNEARGPSNVSSYYTDRFNVHWLTDAARAGVLAKTGGAGTT